MRNSLYVVKNKHPKLYVKAFNGFEGWGASSDADVYGSEVLLVAARGPEEAEVKASMYWSDDSPQLVFPEVLV